MDDYERALQSAILRDLKITSPPYRLMVDSGPGDVAITLRDPRNTPSNDPSGGALIHTMLIREGLLENEIPATAKLVADEIRPHLKTS